MIKEFYYGSSWKWPLPYLPRVMLSYNMLRNYKKPWNIEKPFMMDSGAYSVIARYGKYPYSISEYAEAIEKWKPDITWTMDYPCEPSVRKKGGYTPKHAQELTINNQIKLLDQNANTQMVLQGWEAEDYLEHIDIIKSHGLLTEHMGIGSICRRGHDNEIAMIIRLVKSNLPSWVKLHGFGIKVSVLKRTDAKFNLYSADSQAWGYEMRYGDWLKGEYNGKTYKDKIPNLLDYIDRMEAILNLSEKSLDDYLEVRI